MYVCTCSALLDVCTCSALLDVCTCSALLDVCTLMIYSNYVVYGIVRVLLWSTALPYWVRGNVFPLEMAIIDLLYSAKSYKD